MPLKNHSWPSSWSPKKFPDHKKHFLYRITDYLFINTFNQRMRRGMLQNVGGVWYERFIEKMTQMAIWKKRVLPHCLWVQLLLLSPFHGYIVRKAAGVPWYLLTKDELSKAIQFFPRYQFVGQMMKIQYLLIDISHHDKKLSSCGSASSEDIAILSWFLSVLICHDLYLWSYCNR